MILYSLSNGEYSDYRVLALFETKELAEQAAATYLRWEKYSSPHVEEFKVLTERPEPIMLTRLSILVRADGTTGDVREMQVTRWPWDADYTTETRVDASNASMNPGGIFVEGTGSNRAHVEKAFYDRVARIKAEQWGIA
jgi:hypothetical protein